MKKKISAKQVLAIIAAALLVGLYISALVLSLIGSEAAQTLLKISLLGTFIIPIIIYVIMMFYRIGHKKEEPVPDTYADEKDDPYGEQPDNGGEDKNEA
ncbi:MAG: hypothetical protein NC223_05125 [Butyrivibrio sp.]|nr:hypothetical protein [Butyrivibrio sp.]